MYTYKQEFKNALKTLGIMINKYIWLLKVVLKQKIWFMNYTT